MIVTFAVVTFEAVIVAVSGWVVGRLVFGFAGDPLDEFGHDGKAGAEDYGCEFAHAVHIVSIVRERIGLGRGTETLTSIARL